MANALLVLGAGTDQLYMIKTAKKMGLKVVAVDGNPEAPGLFIADYAQAIDFVKIDQVIRYCEKLISQGVKLKGVSTMGSDIPHLVSKVSSYFDWTGPSLETGILASHKYKMKVRFKEMGVAVPKFSIVKNSKKILACWDEWKVKRVIIKPTDRAGSRGIRVISSRDEVDSAFKYASSHSINGEILLEEYIEGLQISTETIVVDGHFKTPGFADRVYEEMQCFWPNIMENGGWLPSLIDKKLYLKVISLVENSAKALGIKNGVAKGDVVICPKKGPMMIEMAARLSGGDFSESLVPLSTGVNYVRTVIEIAMGVIPDMNELKPKKNKVVANRYFFPPKGILNDIRGVEKARKTLQLNKLDLYVKSGDTLPEIDSHGKRAGVFVVFGDDRESVQNIINNIYNTIEFQVDGVWVTGDPKKYTHD
jgi:biotin carboxylase